MKYSTRPVDRRESEIKKKLTAAIAMLLVSCIMVVTSTYAWFTLSTAPEVTGIHTNIAGNGNLEIALANKDTWTKAVNVQTLSGTSDSLVTTNASWGNLIQIDSTHYGTNLLTLSPAALTYVDKDRTTVSENILSVPKYGADGRVESLADNTLSAIYNGSSFTKNTDADYGLRALGISSKMTERQSSFSSAILAINNNRNLASSVASKAMETNGGKLATVAVKLATSSDRTNVTIEAEELSAIKTLISDIKGTDSKLGAVSYLDKAVIAAVKAYLASSDNQGEGKIDDATYNLMESALDSLSILNNSQVSLSGDTITFQYGDSLSKTVTNQEFANLIKEIRDINSQLENALASLEGKTEGKYSDIEEALNALMNLGGTISVAGKPLTEIKDNIIVNGEINTTYAMQLAQNCVIELGANSGVIYDIASLSGTVKSNIKFNIEYSGLKLNDQEAVITSSNDNPLLKVLHGDLATKAPSSAGSNEANIISDIYGYALDLLFRTNASESKLKLQTTPVDRIYADNNNSETMGAGSTMTFTSTTAAFGEDKMISLIKSIKIVFVDSTNKVLAHAVLDTTVNGDGTKNYVVENGQIICNIRLLGADNQMVDINNQVLTPLTANAVTGISTIVYLDGNTVQNSDVANAATSMTATMNLQFSSTAILDPMDYSGLYIPQSGNDD